MEGSRLTREMIRAYAARGLWTGAFLDAHLVRHASERPEHPAVVSPARGGPAEARLTYRQLADAAPAGMMTFDDLLRRGGAGGLAPAGPPASTQVPGLTRERVPALRTFITAWAPIPPVVVRDAAARLGCTVHSAWGMTEYGIGTAVGAEDPQERAATTGGRAVPGAEVRVVDDSGRQVAPGEEGDLLIRGAGLFIGYYKRPDFTEGSFTPDGFLVTGDRARIDASGFIRLTGRTKDIIIRGGENIPVAEIEAMLYAHPKVEDAAIVAMPDERLGERACACVVPRPGASGLTLDELTSFLLGRQIAKPKLPERLELIEALPRTASGKVQKFKLREDIREKLAAAGRARPGEPGEGGR